MSTYMISKIKNELTPLGFVLESPENFDERGSHLTLSHEHSWQICQCLTNPVGNKIKVIPDFRPERYIRFGLAPLYLSFNDIKITVQRLKEIVENKEYENKKKGRPIVT